MRSYGEYCGVARALDVIGDRWSLLIVRELALRGDCRYSDLASGLPGISTNLLADRLRELEGAEVVAKIEPAPPVATPVFRLTEHGRALEPMLRTLMNWGMRYMVPGPREGDAFFGRWLLWPAQQYLIDRDPEAPPSRVMFEAEGEAIDVAAAGGAVVVSMQRGEVLDAPDARVGGDPHPLLGLISGHLTLDQAAAMGVSWEGSRAAIERLLPDVPPA